MTPSILTAAQEGLRLAEAGVSTAGTTRDEYAVAFTALQRHARNNYADICRELIRLHAENERLRAAAKATLLFHSASPWTPEKRIEWANHLTICLGPAIQRDSKVVGSNQDGTWDGATPTNEATTKNLCNAARAALAQTGEENT